MSKNPLIQDLIKNDAFPAVSIALPSGGRWYGVDVLDDEVDPLDIPVGILGVLAEQNYRDPWLILSGEAVPRMLRAICPSVAKPEELCEIDLEAILLASRLVSYGPTIELKYQCLGPKPETTDEIKEEKVVEDVKDDDTKDDHTKDDHTKDDQIELELTCGFENTIIIDVNEHIMRYSPMEDDAAIDYVLPLERFNQTVHLRPMPYKNVMQLIKDNIQRDRKVRGLNKYQIDDLVVDPDVVRQYTKIVDMTTESSIDSIVSSIFCVESAKGVRVNGTEFIKEWLLALSMVEVELITVRINELATRQRKRSEIKFSCSECNHENIISLELDAQRLFGPAGASPMPTKPSPKSKRGARKKKTSSRVLRP